jgi:ABC-type amino acid transport substrate-binding protein
MRLSPRPLAAALALAAVFGTPRTARADLEQMQKTGELKVLVVDGAAVFVSLAPTGQPGLEREILDGFAAMHHLKVKLVEVAAWKDLVPSLVEGKGDLIAGGVGVLPSRLEKIDFTTEVFPTRDVVISRRPTPVVTSLDQLRGMKVGTIKGTGLADRIVELKVPKTHVDENVPATGFLEALQSKRVDALVDDVEDALLLRKLDPAVQIGMFVGEPQSMAFGVRKNCKHLRDALSEYVANFRHSPTWNRLVVKYFGSDAALVLKRARGE